MSIQQHDGELLTAYVLGALGEDEVRAVEEHVRSCERCRAELAELREIEVALGEVPPEAFLDGPPEGGELLLQRTLRQARAERAGSDRRRRSAVTVAAVAAAAAVLGGGILIGRSTGGGVQAVPLPVPTSVSLPPTPSAGTTVAAATDPQTGAGMRVQVTPAAHWVRISASVSGIPAGERCRLVVVGKDGTKEVAGSWLVSGQEKGTTLDGSAAIALDDVASVAVENTDGEIFVTVPV